MARNLEPVTALFDLDGVVIDTETQYSTFWHRQGVDYLGINDLESRIKGQTLTFIYDTFFPGMLQQQAEITEKLLCFEQNMSYDYIAGVCEFINDLRENQVHLAVVTSSNEDKMKAVYRAHPELKEWFDAILTAEMFAASKPAPDCFLLGMKQFSASPASTYVFEDSFNGLKAGMASEATVIGLATTNSRRAITPCCHYVLDDFTGFTYEKMLSVNK